jgi:hypothetical protein
LSSWNLASVQVEEVSIRWSDPPGMEGQWFDRAGGKVEVEKEKEAAEEALPPRDGTSLC